MFDIVLRGELADKQHRRAAPRAVRILGVLDPARHPTELRAAVGHAKTTQSLNGHVALRSADGRVALDTGASGAAVTTRVGQISGLSRGGPGRFGALGGSSTGAPILAGAGSRLVEPVCSARGGPSLPVRRRQPRFRWSFAPSARPQCASNSSGCVGSPSSLRMTTLLKKGGPRAGESVGGSVGSPSQVR